MDRLHPFTFPRHPSPSKCEWLQFGRLTMVCASRTDSWTTYA